MVTKCALLDKDVARHHTVIKLTTKEHCLLFSHHVRFIQHFTYTNISKHCLLFSHHVRFIQHFTYTNISTQWLLFKVTVLYRLGRQDAAYTVLFQQYICATGVLSYINTLPTNYVV